MVGKRFGLLLCCLWGLSSGLRGQPSEALERLLEAVELRHAVIGISVKAVADGRIVIDRSGDKSLQPASVCKLLSSALALNRYHCRREIKRRYRYRSERRSVF